MADTAPPYNNYGDPNDPYYEIRKRIIDAGVSQSGPGTAGAARSAALNDALGDNTINDRTKQELQSLYESGAHAETIAATIASARKGEGIYGIRNVNAAQKSLYTTAPGRSALSNLGITPLLAKPTPAQGI